MDNQTMEQGSGGSAWYIVGAVIIVAFALWYVYGKQTPPASTEMSAVEQVGEQPLSSGNTTADISADLNQIPDTSAVLDTDAAASAAAVSNF